MHVFDSKKVNEYYALGFDFSRELSSISSASFSVTVLSGEDENSSDILESVSTIQGSKVFVRIRNGIAQTVYKITCFAVGTCSSGFSEGYELSAKISVF